MALQAQGRQRESERRKKGGMDGEKRLWTRERKGSIKKSNYFDEGKRGVGEGWGGGQIR